MPVRRLTRGGGLESGGPDEPVSAARVEPPEAADSRDRQAGSAADEAIMEATAALVDKEPDGVPISSETQFEMAAEPVPMMPAEVLKGALQELLSSRAEKHREQEQAPKVTVDAMKQALVALLQEAGESFPDKSSASGGGGDPQQKQEEPPKQKEAQGQERPYSETKLQHAAAQVISQLHAAKQELAKELEANLKQLKSVLQETQRIAKDMEAVLKEAKAEPSEQELARGGGGKKQEPWNPPGLKTKGKQQQDEDESSEDDESSKQQGQVPEWEPPQDAVQH